MIRLIAIMAGFLAASVSFAQDKSPIRLPVVPGDTLAMPMPSSTDVVITPEMLYVVESDVEILAFTSPGGAIKVTKEVGPLRMRGKFVDGKSIETREFKAKFLLLVDAVKDGRDELIIVPVGAKSESEAKRVFLTVGKMPQPPPRIDPKVDPDLGPVAPSVAPIKADGLHVLIVYKPGQALPETQNAILFGEAARNLLNTKCVKDARGLPAYRIYADGVQFGDELQLWKDAYNRSRKAIPWLVISNGKEGFEGPLPATVGDLETLVYKYSK